MGDLDVERAELASVGPDPYRSPAGPTGPRDESITQAAASTMQPAGLRAGLRWSAQRTFGHRTFSEQRLRAHAGGAVSVCLPARNEAATIGPIVEALVGLRERGLVKEVVVVDARSADDTAAIASRAGAVVHRDDTLMPDFGPVLGKGDAMWRALSVMTGDIVCYLDADSELFGEHFARGVMGPLLCWDDVHFVKGCYRRPFQVGDLRVPVGGGRVNELTARPLLNAFYPDLAAIRQPLAGEFAARRSLLERLPFLTGYAVEMGLLVDAYRAVGLDGLAQVDLGVRQNRHRALSELGPMAYAVLAAVARRLGEEGRLQDRPPGAFAMSGEHGLRILDVEVVERPPIASVLGPFEPTRRRLRDAGAGRGEGPRRPSGCHQGRRAP